jgi:hypothetical protein
MARETIWKANRTWVASMAARQACRSLRTEAQRSRASFATSGDRNNQRTGRVLNTSAGEIAAMIRLVIRNSDSLFYDAKLGRGLIKIVEFVAHNSRLRLEYLNHTHSRIINPQRPVARAANVLN